ncbi:MAG: Lsr2 family protein [Candidatus Binataceae bacterium]|jgi:hypothetical protein
MRKESKVLFDDILGEPHPADITIPFSVGDASYEIDLNTGHAAAFYAALELFTSKARLVGTTERPKPRVIRRRGEKLTPSGYRSRPMPQRRHAQAVRDWARADPEWRKLVQPKGRIPNRVYEAYDKVH